MPFLTNRQLENLVMIHKSMLSDDETVWFESECQKLQNETKYILYRRSSGDTAFMMYLLAEKNMSVDDIFNLSARPKDEVLGYMKDFFGFYNKPEYTTEDKVEQFGKVNIKAVEKILDYHIPDPGEITNQEQLADMQKKVYILKVLYTDMTQDTEAYTHSHNADRKLREYYYRGTGGSQKLDKYVGRWTVFSNSFTNLFDNFTSEHHTDQTRCPLFDLVKDFLKEYGGKKLKDIPLRLTNELTVMTSMGVDLGTELDNPENPDPDEPDPDEIDHEVYKNYLNGLIDTYPGQKRVKREINNAVIESRAKANTGFEEKLRDLVAISMDADIAGLLTEEQMKMTDLTLLPEDIKQKMISIYRNSFGTYYKDITKLYIESNNLTEFDLIKNGSGNSIRKLAGQKYAKYDEMTQDNALMLETIRAMALDKNGLKLQYVEAKPDGKFTLSKPKKLKRVADYVNLYINHTFNKEVARDYLDHPDEKGFVFKSATTFKHTFERVLANQKEIMSKYNIDMFDCIYVGKKTLRQLFNEKCPNKPFGETMSFGFLAAASHGDEPLFVTALSEENGNLKRNIVPITFRGNLYSPSQSKEAVTRQTRSAAKAIIERENATLASAMLIDTDPFLGRKTVEPQNKPFDKKFLEEQDGAKIVFEAFSELQANYFIDHPEYMERLYPTEIGKGDFGKNIGVYMSENQEKQAKQGEVPKRKTGRIPDYTFMVSNMPENALKPGDNKKIKEISKEIYNSLKKDVDLFPDSEKVYKAQYRLLLNMLDTENVSYIKMIDDNPITAALVVMNNFGPAVFRHPGNLGYISRDQISQRLTVKGTLLPAVSAFSGIDDIIGAEYQKQRDESSGWSAEKEQRYFFKLKKGYENIIKSYEEMERWPYKDQIIKGEDFEDNLASMTNLEHAPRGLADSAIMMKWEIQGMKNGWHADNIHVLGGIGSIEGAFIKHRSRIKHKLDSYKEDITGMEDGEDKIWVENEIKNCEEQLKALKEFGEEKLENFKKSILGKKIRSPRDILDCLNKFENFMKDNAELKVVKDFDLFKNASAFKSYVDEVSNNAIEDVKKMMKDPKSIEKKYKATVLPEYKGVKPEDIVREITAENEIPAAAAEILMQKYVKEMYLSHLFTPDHPELFNEKDPDHKWAMSKVDAQVKNYTTEFMEKLAGGKDKVKNFSISGEEFADILKYSHHEVYFTEMDNEIRYQRAKDGFDLLVNRNLMASDGRQIAMVDAMKEGLSNLEKGNILLGGSNLYNDVQVELQNIIKIKTRMDKKLKKLYDEKKDCTIDPKEFKRLKKRVSTLCGAMQSYIKKKDSLKKKNGSLGRNGEKRYNAMKKSMYAVYCYAQALERYGNSGPLEADFSHKAVGLKKGDAGYGLKPEAVKTFVEKQKGFKASELANLNRQVDEALTAEENKRIEALNKGVNGQIEIIRSIDKTLYLTTVKKAYGNGSDSLSKTEDIIKEYSTKLNDLKRYKEKSKHLKLFMDDYINNTGFKEVFLDEVSECANLGKVSNADILSCRDKALTTMFNNAKGSPETMEKLDMVARMTGSPVNSEALGLKGPAAPNVHVQHKAAGHQNNAVNNPQIGK